MQLTVGAAARLLNVREETVYEWIERGQIVAGRFNERYLINKIRLLEYAYSHGLPLTYEAEPGGTTLAEALSRGGVWSNVPGQTKDELLWWAVEHLALPEGYDPRIVFELLRSREQQTGGAASDGIAIPHVRGPFLVPEMPARLFIYHPERPVDFQAADGRPVHTFFLLVTRTNHEHLYLLSGLARDLQDEAFRKMISERAPQSRMLQALVGLSESGGTLRRGAST